MLTSENRSSHSSYPERQGKPRFQRSKLRPLSQEERAQVCIATFRESVNHRRWPRDVVEQFLAVRV